MFNRCRFHDSFSRRFGYLWSHITQAELKYVLQQLSKILGRVQCRIVKYSNLGEVHVQDISIFMLMDNGAGGMDMSIEIAAEGFGKVVCQYVWGKRNVCTYKEALFDPYGKYNGVSLS